MIDLDPKELIKEDEQLINEVFEYWDNYYANIESQILSEYD